MSDLIKQHNVIKSVCGTMNIESSMMQDLLDAVDLCAELTSEYDESHNVEHHICVFTNAVEIFRRLKCSKNILRMIAFGALLHDTVDSKYPKDIDTKTKKVEKFLMQKMADDWSDTKWIIDNISYSKEAKYGYPFHEKADVMLARDILSDADKIEALGNTGIARVYQYTKAKYPNASPDEIRKHVVQHCDEKLLRLRDQFIRTTPGKEMSLGLHQIILNHRNTNA